MATTRVATAVQVVAATANFRHAGPGIAASISLITSIFGGCSSARKWTPATTVPGPYYIFIKADSENNPTTNGWIVEGNETNNVGSRAITLPSK